MAYIVFKINKNKLPKKGVVKEANIMAEELKIEGYCVKCKTKKQMKNAKKVTLPNGRPAAQGLCPECGTKMFRIGDPSKAK